MKEGSWQIPVTALVLAAIVASGELVVEVALPRSADGGAGTLARFTFIFAVAAVVIGAGGFWLARRLRRFADALDRLEDGDRLDLPGLGVLTRAVERHVTAVAERAERQEEIRREHEVRTRVAETELHRLRTVLGALPDAVIVVDPFDDIVTANESAAECLGFDRAAALRRPLSASVGLPGLVRLATDVRESGDFDTTRNLEFELDTESGSRVYKAIVRCLRGPHDRVSGVMILLHDLTGERELAQLKSDFVAKASHELRTPLSSISAYIEMLVDGEAETEESRREFHGIIQAEAERLGRLIDNMLNISRIEAGIVQVDRAQVDVKEIIARAVDTIEPQAEEKSIDVAVRLAEVDLRVEADEDMVYRAVLNLLSNAVKYTPAEGRVIVQADSDNLTRSVVVSVSDTGLGIPPDQVESVFEKFFRVENYKRVAEGTGLGLSLVKHIVETVHRGQIGVESKLGMGSKFWFSIPMRHEGGRAAA